MRTVSSREAFAALLERVPPRQGRKHSVFCLIISFSIKKLKILRIISSGRAPIYHAKLKSTKTTCKYPATGKTTPCHLHKTLCRLTALLDRHYATRSIYLVTGIYPGWRFSGMLPGFDPRLYSIFQDIWLGVYSNYLWE